MQNLIREMLRIRMVEEEIARRYPEGKMRTPVHLSIGQEAAAVGVCAALGPDDLVVSTHRSHAHYLAKGGSLNALIAELYGKATGCSAGYGGSMHLTDTSVGFIGSTSIVGGTIPVGVGLAWAKRLRGEAGTVVIFIGDACLETGVFHEAANFAGLHSLKVLFILEDNNMSCYTPIDERQPPRIVRDIGNMYNMARLSQHDIDVEQLRKATEILLAEKGPAIFRIYTRRFYEHCGPGKLIEPDDTHLFTGIDRAPIQAEIDAAFAAAEAAPWPDRAEMESVLYG